MNVTLDATDTSLNCNFVRKSRDQVHDPSLSIVGRGCQCEELSDEVSPFERGPHLNPDMNLCSAGVTRRMSNTGWRDNHVTWSRNERDLTDLKLNCASDHLPSLLHAWMAVSRRRMIPSRPKIVHLEELAV